MKKLNVHGVIIPNDYKWYYDWLDEDSTCPRDVSNILNDAKGDEVEVYINSPGGIIEAGSEIYTLLRAYEGDVKIYIVGEACSSASVIAMARHSEMSPTALMMVHCVSSGVRGNHSTMEKMAEVLKTADDALSNAYMQKTGMTKQEALEMMEQETWLTAAKAKELGLIDGIMFEEEQVLRLSASNFKLPSEEKMNEIKTLIGKQNQEESGSVFLIQETQAKLNLMRLRGEM